MIKSFKNIVSKGIRAVVVVSCVALAAMTLLLVVDVCLRNLWHRSLSGTIEIVELLMVVSVFTTLAYTSLNGGQISVDSIVSRFSPRAQAILKAISSLLGVLVFGLFARQIGLRAWAQIGSPLGLRTTMLEIPLAPFLALASFGCILFCLQQLVEMIEATAKFVKE